MCRFRDLSIQKKILLSMLAFTLIPIILVAAVATSITYKTMREQLIYDHRMSSSWLQDRLSLELNNMQNQFYEFEVNKDVKNDIFNWCEKGKSLNYSEQWRIITLMNSIISVDSRMNAVEIFNLSNDEALIATRSGASLSVRGNRLSVWESREVTLQSNLVFLRGQNELVVAHQIHRFEDKLPIALIIFRMRPYQLQSILAEIKSVPEEAILVFNDQNEIIEADYGIGWSTDADTLETIRKELSESGKKEGFYNNGFWFYRSINGGKLRLLSCIPNQTIVNALRPTIASCIFVAIIAIAASIICSVVYSRAVSKPIRKLSEEMKIVTLSNYNGKTEEHRTDEVGILQTSFDYMIKRNRELFAQQYQAKLEKRNAQLRALQAQINPHFMYNTLQVIGGMALEKDVPEIYTITLALSDIMRYSLSFSKEAVPLSEEIQYLKSYITIQNERFGQKICLRLHLAPETEECLIPKLILQPLVENSFEHGLLNKGGRWELSIESSLTETNDLLIVVKDNGIGFEKERLEEIRRKLSAETDEALRSGSHIGLANVHARIKLHSRNEAHGISIVSSAQEGTSIRVLMPAQWKKEEPHEL